MKAKLSLVTYIIYLSLSAAGQHRGSQEGTTLAYVISNNQLYIASDSKVNHTYGNSTTTCKISHVDGFVWSKTGFVDHEKGFSSDKIIRQVLTNHRSMPFDSICRLISSRIKKEIHPFLPLFIQDKRTMKLNKDRKIMSTFLCGFENGKMVYEARQYSYTGSAEKPTAIDNVELTHRTPNYGASIGVNGVNDSAKAVLDYLERNKLLERLNLYRPKVVGEPGFQFRTLGDFVFYLVYVQTVATPQYVGNPVSVARFSINGFEWLRNEIRCK